MRTIESSFGKTLVLAAVLMFMGCTRSRPSAEDVSSLLDAGGTPPVAPVYPSVVPAVQCAIPPEGQPVDTTHPDHVVGDGTPASCTGQALQAAVSQGGIVTFNCGPNPITLTLTQPIAINNIAGPNKLGDTVIDGGGLVTLSGGGTSRIIYLNACDQPRNNGRCDIFPHPQLTVQNLVFVDAYDNSPNGGGAIYREGGVLHVINSQFYRNQCAQTGSDTAGGAVRLIHDTPAWIVGSIFGSPGQGNSCTNGGAIGAQQAAELHVINSIIDSNAATGTGGNPGNGGSAGGIYYDGGPLFLDLCGVMLVRNTGNSYGAAIFYTDELGLGTVHIANSEISYNTVSPTAQFSQAAGAYLQGANVTLANTTMAFNSARYAGNLFIRRWVGTGSITATNLTIAHTQGDGIGLTLVDSVGGTLLNSTIAGNTVGIYAADQLTLQNTLVADNGTNCMSQPMSAGGNFQYPDSSCGGGIPTVDPQIGGLADAGGAIRVHTMPVSPTSPALSAGNGCPAIDARGAARPANGCTSGAYQVN